MNVDILPTASALASCGWDDLLGSADFGLSSSWLGVLEGVAAVRSVRSADPAVQTGTVRPFYVVAADERGRTIAGLAAHMMTRDAPAWDFYRLDRALRRLAALPDRDQRGFVGVRGPEPLVLMPHLLLGGRQTAHSRLLLASWLPAEQRRQAMMAVLERVEGLGRQVGARALAFMFVDADDPLRDALAGRGYKSFLHASAGIMDIEFGSFDGYLSRFSAHRRQRIRRELREFSEAGVVFSEHPLGEVIEQITPLGMALESRYGAEGDTVAAFQASLRVVSDAVGSDAVVLTAEQGGQIRGYVIALRWRDALILRSAGFDYDFKGALPLYYGVAFYHPIQYAISCGLRTIYYGIEAVGAKASRGCRIVDQFGMVQGLDGEAQAALKQVLRAGPLSAGQGLSR
jgi:uncharacterized protein